MGDGSTTRCVGLDVLQKLTAVCVVDGTGCWLWRGRCATTPAQTERAVRGRAGGNGHVGLQTGPMTPWLVHELCGRGLDVVCLDARHASAALKLQINKTDQNDAEGLAQIMRTGGYRPVPVKSLVGMATRLSNHIRGCSRRLGCCPARCGGFPLTDALRSC